MKRFKLEDLPKHMQAQALAILNDYDRPTPQLQPIPVLEAKPARIAKGPNKTEANYRQTYLRGKDARFEALTFRMANGHRYTPDWVVFEAGKPIACHECKGGYALHSQQRARLAFDQCAKEFPAFTWTWAVKSKSGWEITHA